jgi:hypothetical protein
MQLELQIGTNEGNAARAQTTAADFDDITIFSEITNSLRVAADIERTPHTNRGGTTQVVQLSFHIGRKSAHCK